MSTAIEFRAVRQPSGTVDTDLIDVELNSSFNRASSNVSLTFTDGDGTKLDDYPYGRRVQIDQSTDGGSTWTTRLEGFTADRARQDTGEFPALAVTVLPYSHLLRRRDVYKSYTSDTISTILQDLIETFTAVTWNASNVTVTNDKTISREFKGERVDEAISYLASISADEEWFVNDDLEFVFQQQSSSTAPAIADTDHIRHEFPEEATVAINRYELFYNSGGSEDRIVVADLPLQETLQDRLNAARAVELSESDTLPEVTDRDRAEEIARQRLDSQSQVTTGTVTVPLGRFGTGVGDVVDVTISDAGIDSQDFRVAAIEYRWQAGETTLTLAENVDFVDDILVALSDRMTNVRARDADTTVTATRFLDVLGGVTLSLDATLTTKTPTGSAALYNRATYNQDTYNGGVDTAADVSVETTKATVPLLNLCRDLWQDGNAEFTDLTHVGVGTSDDPANKGDGTLTAAVDREAVEKFGAGNAAEKFEFTATIPAGGVYAEAADLAEFGIFDADSGGSMYARVTFADTTIDADTRLKLQLEVTVDTDSDLQGVVVNKGQERLRDLIIGESDHEPHEMVYGDDSTDATASDTALGNRQHSDTIDSFADRSPGVTDIVEETTDGEADTTGFAEIGYENSGNELLYRATFPALDADVVLISNTRFQASNA